MGVTNGQSQAAGEPAVCGEPAMQSIRSTVSRTIASPAARRGCRSLRRVSLCPTGGALLAACSPPHRVAAARVDNRYPPHRMRRCGAGRPLPGRRGRAVPPTTGTDPAQDRVEIIATQETP